MGDRGRCHDRVLGERGQLRRASDVGAIAGGTPTVLADQQRRPFKLAIHDGMLYWTNNSGGTVMKLPVGGGTPVLIASGRPTPQRSRSTRARCTGRASVKARSGRCRSPRAGTIETLASDQDAISLFVLDMAVYWANVEIVDSVRACSSCPATRKAWWGSHPARRRNAAVADHLHVYWTDDTRNAIIKVPVGGGEATLVAAGSGSPSENPRSMDRTSTGSTLSPPARS